MDLCLPPGTWHDWRLRCDAVNLYHNLFGLTRPSCLPLPELGLVLNLKEKKAVLNPTIKSDSEGLELAPDMVFCSSVSAQDTLTVFKDISLNIYSIQFKYSVLFFCFQVKEEHVVMEQSLSSIALTPQGLKRKAETPLASPPEPGQVLQDEPMGKLAVKTRVSYCR